MTPSSTRQAQSEGNRQKPRHGRIWRFSRGTLVTLVVLAVVLLGLRIALPFILRNAINDRLAKVPEYSGGVESVHVALWRGAYALNNLRLTKTLAGENVPFFSSRKIDFSLAWRELFRGKIVSDIRVDSPRLNFVQTKSAETTQVPVDRRWQDAIQDIFPIDITHLEIIDGRIRYQDNTQKPAVDFFVNDLHTVVTGLRNRPEEDNDEMPAKLTAEGVSVGLGKLEIFGQAEPLAAAPRFELRVTLDKISLPALNDFLRAYANVDVSAGTLDVYTEVAAREGRFQGYVKPFLREVNFKSVGDKERGVFHRIWEWIVGGTVKILKNDESEQTAMRIPFAGEFGATQVGIWPTIVSAVRNGFTRALPAALEQSVKSDRIPPKGEPVRLPPEPPATPPSKAAGQPPGAK